MVGVVYICSRVRACLCPRVRAGGRTCVYACACIYRRVCIITVRDGVPTFAHDPDARKLGELELEGADPRVNDVFGSEGVIDDKHVTGYYAHLEADQPHAVQVIQEGAVAHGVTVYGTQLIRHVHKLVASHEAPEPAGHPVQTSNDDASRIASDERVLDAHGLEPLHRRPGPFSRPRLPPLRDQLRTLSEAAHAHAQITSAGIRSDHPESVRHQFPCVVVGGVVNDHVDQEEIVLLVSEDVSTVV